MSTRQLLNALVLILSVSLFLLCGCTPSLQFNGVYQSEKVEESWYYVRFYDDDSVITGGRMGDVHKIIS